MSFFEKPVLFSEVTGVVVENGIPVVNVEVHRQLKHNSTTLADSTLTDSNGSFYLMPVPEEV